MAIAPSFGSAVYGDNDDVGLLLQSVDDALDGGHVLVGMLERVGVMSEGTEPDPDAFPDEDGRFRAPLQSGKVDPLLAEDLLG